jgi:hypothetical protein
MRRGGTRTVERPRRGGGLVGWKVELWRGELWVDLGVCGAVAAEASVAAGDSGNVSESCFSDGATMAASSISDGCDARALSSSV